MTTSPSLLPVHKRYKVTFSHGEGAYLFDNDGKKYLDFGAGIAVNALGHCHPKMVEAITNQAKKSFGMFRIFIMATSSITMPIDWLPTPLLITSSSVIPAQKVSNA